MCDIAHARWVERIVGDFRNEQLAMAITASLGAKYSHWPTLAERLDGFDAALASAPARIDSEDAELRAALGLRSAT